jgi:hypothetical protein
VKSSLPREITSVKNYRTSVPARLIKKAWNVIMEIGSRGQLECLAKGDPPLEFEWLKGHARLHERPLTGGDGQLSPDSRQAPLSCNIAQDFLYK